MIAKRAKNAATEKGGKIASRKVLPIRKGEQLGWGVGLSFAVHLLLVLVVVFWPGLTSSSRRQFLPTYNVSLVSAPKLQTSAPAEGPKNLSAPKPEPKPAVKSAEQIKAKPSRRP